MLGDFAAQRHNQVWLPDITEPPTGEGRLYVCAVKNVFAGRIVGWAIGEQMTSECAETALCTAIARSQPTGTVILHSDRGGQFGRFGTCGP